MSKKKKELKKVGKEIQVALNKDQALKTRLRDRVAAEDWNAVESIAEDLHYNREKTWRLEDEYRKLE